VQAHPTHDDVIRVATELLCHDGPEAVSVRNVATRLGVSTQVVYSRFGGKPGLVDAMVLRGHTLLAAHLAGVTEPLGSPARVVALGHAYRQAALAEPALYQVMFDRPVVGYTPSPASRDAARASFRPLHDAITACWDAGTLRPTPAVPEPATLAHMCWAAAHGLVSLTLAGHHPPGDATAVLDATATALLTPHLPGSPA
jgi:AcrR family transcriptional regulator